MTDATLSETDAATAYTLALMAVDRLEEFVDERGERKYGMSVPAGVLCWGDARLLLPALIAFAAIAFPKLTDPETLEGLIRNASTADAKGRPN